MAERIDRFPGRPLPTHELEPPPEVPANRCGCGAVIRTGAYACRLCRNAARQSGNDERARVLYAQGLSYEAIAEQLGLAPSTVRGLLATARRTRTVQRIRGGR